MENVSYERRVYESVDNTSLSWVIQGVSLLHVQIFTTYGGMKTTVYGNFILCKFKFSKKLQHFEFICEKNYFRYKISIFYKKSGENWLRGVIKGALHSCVYKNSKN